MVSTRLTFIGAAIVTELSFGPASDVLMAFR